MLVSSGCDALSAGWGKGTEGQIRQAAEEEGMWWELTPRMPWSHTRMRTHTHSSTHAHKRAHKCTNTCTHTTKGVVCLWQRNKDCLWWMLSGSHATVAPEPSKLPASPHPPLPQFCQCYYNITSPNSPPLPLASVLHSDNRSPLLPTVQHMLTTLFCTTLHP